VVLAGNNTYNKQNYCERKCMHVCIMYYFVLYTRRGSSCNQRSSTARFIASNIQFRSSISINANRSRPVCVCAIDLLLNGRRRRSSAEEKYDLIVLIIGLGNWRLKTQTFVRRTFVDQLFNAAWIIHWRRSSNWNGRRQLILVRF